MALGDDTQQRGSFERMAAQMEFLVEDVRSIKTIVPVVQAMQAELGAQRREIDRNSAELARLATTERPLPLQEYWQLVLIVAVIVTAIWAVIYLGGRTG